MKKTILSIFLVFVFISCSNDKNNEEVIETPTINLKTEITSPLKNRDYTFHDNGKYGIFEDPITQKKLTAKIILEEGNTTSNDNFIVKWKSDIDGALYEGKPNKNLESEITINLSKGLHKILFEVYTSDKKIIKKDSIVISNIIKLDAVNDTGRSTKLNWTKYEGNDFTSYLIYGEDFKFITEINDINTLTYEILETKSLIKEQKYQIIVKTTKSYDGIMGSNIVSKVSGIFIKFPYYVPKIIKDDQRSKIYAIVAPRFKSDKTDKYGLLIIDTKTFTIESHILTNDRFSDLDISPDSRFLYLTQNYVEKLTKIDLNTMSVVNFTTTTNGWGFHKIEAGNNNVLFCHVTPPTSGSTGIASLDGTNGNQISTSYYGYSHGDIEFNSKNGKLYMGESNTSSGVIYCNTYINQDLKIENPYPFFPYPVMFPDPFILISDDNNSVFWENYQLGINLQINKTFNTKIIACSPNNLYLSDIEKIYDYNKFSVIFNYPPFPSNDNTKTILFIDDNTIITSKAYQPNFVNEPAITYFFKMKIN